MTCSITFPRCDMCHKYKPDMLHNFSDMSHLQFQYIRNFSRVLLTIAKLYKALFDCQLCALFHKRKKMRK